MVSVTRPANDQVTLRCPECGWDWFSPYRPGAYTNSVQVIRFKCPNRHCKQPHWFIAYRIHMFPRPRLRVVDVVRCFGYESEAARRSLRQISELDAATIDELVALMALQPERTS